MYQRTRVKICGVTRAADVAAACRLGADAVGFVCHAGSARYVAPERLDELARALAPLVTPVLLFVDAEPAQVRRALEAMPSALLQFHGTQTRQECELYARPYLRAVALAEGVDLLEFERRFASACAILADAPVEGHGGGGRTFDWSLLPGARQRNRPLILAGGLTAENVAAAIARVRPDAVDVSSGVEESRGIKSAARMRAFLAAVRAADALCDAPSGAA